MFLLWDEFISTKQKWSSSCFIWLKLQVYIYKAFHKYICTPSQIDIFKTCTLVDNTKETHTKHWHIYICVVYSVKVNKSQIGIAINLLFQDTIHCFQTVIFTSQVRLFSTVNFKLNICKKNNNPLWFYRNSEQIHILLSLNHKQATKK